MTTQATSISEIRPNTPSKALEIVKKRLYAATTGSGNAHQTYPPIFGYGFPASSGTGTASTGVSAT